MTRDRTKYALITVVVLAAAGLIVLPHLQRAISSRSSRGPHQFTIEDRLREYADMVRRRVGPDFELAGIPYPPAAITLVGLKSERALELYAAGRDRDFRFIRSYHIRAASGHLGPKLKEGDLQVPEGLYQIESLNPNSLYHLALRVNYPNEFDRLKGAVNGRSDLGGDIMIHGNAVSIGCLAIGDEPAEDLFVLAALTGVQNIKVILSPIDFRIRELPAIPPNTPNWTPELYGSIKAALASYTKRAD